MYLAMIETITVMMTTIIPIIKRIPAHDELGMCRTSPVSPEQHVLCIPGNSCTENFKVRLCPCIKQIHTHNSKQRHVLADTHMTQSSIMCLQTHI